MYDAKCRGCRLAHGLDTKVGGFIPLGTYWMVNHCSRSEGFLGWLLMQPRQHRMGLSQFTAEELQEFGIQIKRLETALRQTWPKLQPDDPIERVYVTLFFESALEVTDDYWHIHFHVVPRTKSIGEEEPTAEEEKLGIKDHKGWYIIRHTAHKPDATKLDDKDITTLMNMLRENLDGQ